MTSSRTGRYHMVLSLKMVAKLIFTSFLFRRTLRCSCRLVSRPTRYLFARQRESQDRGNRKTEGNANRLVLIIEYKPPHKLSVAALTAGLRKFNRLDLINRVAISDHETTKYEEKSKLEVARFLAQVYTYMIDSGLEYAYLTTGQAFIFLSVRYSNRKTLYYHMVIPEDAFTDGDRTQILNTAIGQVLSFYILACGGRFYGGDMRERHRKEALKWSKDDKEILANMTPSQQKPSPSSSHFKPHSKPHSKRHAPAHSYILY